MPPDFFLAEPSSGKWAEVCIEQGPEGYQNPGMATRVAGEGVVARPAGGAPSLLPDDLFARFFHWEAAGSVILLFTTAVAVAWANLPWAESYFRLAHVPLGVSFNGAVFELSLQHWINDFLMAIFFFVVGLEIKRELLAGELSTLQKAVLPVTAAVGGALAPAGIYAFFNAGGPGAHGWGVAMATDIAFAIGILAIFGKRVPTGLKVFLTALAIADDVGAVLVVAIFYTETVRIAPLFLSAAVLALGAFFVRSGIRKVSLLTLLGLLTWAGVFLSGLHPTIAGILFAAIIPVRGPEGEQPPSQAIEEYLHPIVAFVILPLFALFNAGVALEKRPDEVLRGPVGLGIVLGLVLGKQAGIVLFSWLSVKARLAAMPEGVSWTQLYGGACLAGIGFTMSLFIADLAFFENRALSAEAKVGILAASLAAAAWAAIVLHRALPRSLQPLQG
jgi:NhaA family Na+:H+ antiporter